MISIFKDSWDKEENSISYYVCNKHLISSYVRWFKVYDIHVLCLTTFGSYP